MINSLKCDKAVGSYKIQVTLKELSHQAYFISNVKYTYLKITGVRMEVKIPELRVESETNNL